MVGPVGWFLIGCVAVSYECVMVPHRAGLAGLTALHPPFSARLPCEAMDSLCLLQCSLAVLSCFICSFSNGISASGPSRLRLEKRSCACLCPQAVALGLSGSRDIWLPGSRHSRTTY